VCDASNRAVIKAKMGAERRAEAPLLRSLMTGALFALAGVMVWSIAVIEGVTVLLVLFFIAGGIARRGIALPRDPILIAVLLYLAATSVSALVSPFPSASLTYFQKLWLHVFLFFVVYSMDIRPDQIRRLGFVFLLSVTLAAVYGIGKYAYGLEERISSASSGYYTLALFVSMGILVGVAALFRPRPLWQKAALILAIAVLIEALFLTFVRASLLAVLLGVCVLLVFRGRPRYLLIFGAVIFVAAILAPHHLIERLAAMFTQEGSSGRLVLWGMARGFIAHLPLFGYGPMSFDSLVTAGMRHDLPDQRVHGWHNDFIHLTIESGWIASALFLVILLLLCFRILAAWRATRQAVAGRKADKAGMNDDRLLMAFLLAAGLVYLVSAQLANIVTDAMFSVFLWIGFAIGAKEGYRVLHCSAAPERAG